MGIHDVFPPDSEDSSDPISEKKLKQNNGLYSTCKTLLGFDIDGNAKTIWLETENQENHLTILKGWILTGHYGAAKVNCAEFKSTIAKLCHAFTCILAGVRLLSTCNWILKARPAVVYLHNNHKVKVLTVPKGCRTVLRESTREPTRCRELTGG